MRSCCARARCWPRRPRGSRAAGRIHRAGRYRRRRRPDGAHDPGHHRQAQADEAADGRDQQVAAAPAAKAFSTSRTPTAIRHKIIITLSNLFTTPLATGIPFNWKDLTPVAMLALDEFILWVNAEKPYKTAKDYVDAAKAANGTFKMGGTGSKQEDQIITVALEKADRRQVHLHPTARRRRGRGPTGRQSHRLDASTIRSRRWRTGAPARCGRCASSMPSRLDYHDKIAGDMSWTDIPTCKSQGLDVEYLMLRGIFMPPGVTRSRSTIMSTCSRRCARRRSGRSS